MINPSSYLWYKHVNGGVKVFNDQCEMKSMDVHCVVYTEQNTFQYTWYAKSCTQHIYHHRFSETWHRLQIILALVIPNYNTPAFYDKGEVVLINKVMATSKVTRVRISCASYQSNSWPKILVCGTETPQVLCKIYNSPCG